MKIAVKLFAGARELVGQDEVIVELQENSTVAELRNDLATTCPALTALLPHALFAIDANYATDDTTIPPNAEIACIPPVSGG